MKLLSGFKNISIQRKQTLIIMLTSSVALLLACAAFVIYDVVNFRRELVGGVSVLAEAIGNNCAAAIDYNDPRTATATLAALHAQERVVSACVYNNDGNVFAVYRRDPNAVFVPPAVQAPGQKFTRDRLNLFRPIKQKEETTGMIFVATDLKDLSARLMRYMSIVGGVFLASSLIALALSSRLQRLVSNPILQLAQMARLVALEKNYSVRATKQSNDELGELVDGFNEMLMQIQARDRRLQESQQELVDASRMAGMAEVATGVLHNVGNVLNSVNVSTNLVVDQLRKSKVSSLARAVKILRDHKEDVGVFLTSDPKGKQLPVFLEAVAEHLLCEQAMLIAETQNLQQNIDHIKQIVTMQQSCAKVSGALEKLAPRELVEDALRMASNSLEHHQIEVIRKFEAVAPVLADRHKVLQILVNLLNNARQALEQRPEGRRLILSVALHQDQVRVEVTDNGVGIAAENLVKVFNHGFTTKRDGHGFGLHSGANDAKKMGGSLMVRSDGPGTGATFILELPVRKSALLNSAPQPGELENRLNRVAT